MIEFYLQCLPKYLLKRRKAKDKQKTRRKKKKKLKDVDTYFFKKQNKRKKKGKQIFQQKKKQMDSCCTFQTEFFRSFSFEKIRKVYIHDNELIVIFDMDADEQTIEQIIQEEKTKY